MRYLQDEIEASNSTATGRAVEKFAAAALGAIPWFGGFVSAVLSLRSDAANAKVNSLQTVWLRDHEAKIAMLNDTIAEIVQRRGRSANGQ